MKVLILKYLAKILDKKITKIAYNKVSCLYKKNQQHFLKKLTNFSKISEILVKTSGKCE